MDFLDSIDQVPHKKSRQVRSWYLYEQYKALERHQLEAAQKLKDKRYQDYLLLQELSERRARRKLYNEFGLSRSDSRITRRSRDDDFSSTLNENDDFYESVSEYQDDESINKTCAGSDGDDTLSQGESFGDKSEIEAYHSAEIGRSLSYEDEEFAPAPDPIDDNKESEIARTNYADDLNHQLEIVKENIGILEQFTKLNENDYVSEEESLKSVRVSKVCLCKKLASPSCNSLISIWTRLVSFAYQLMRLNRGNCYSDYSTQFLAAVLACDVLRRGVNRMSLRFTNPVCQ